MLRNCLKESRVSEKTEESSSHQRGESSVEMWICKELLSNQTVERHRSFYCGTNVCYLSMDPHENTVWHLLLCSLPVYTFVGCHLLAWLNTWHRAYPWGGGSGMPCRGMSAPGLEFPAFLCPATSIAWHQAFTNDSFPQEKNLLPEWTAYLLFLSKHPWFCGSTALHSRSCCHYTSSRTLLSSFWWFLPHCLTSCRLKWQ